MTVALQLHLAAGVLTHYTACISPSITTNRPVPTALQILPRDYLITRDKLAFSVVDYGIEEQRVTCFLRYHRPDNSGWKKLTTSESHLLLKQNYSNYLFESKTRDTIIHGVHLDWIDEHRSAQGAIELLSDNVAMRSVRQRAAEAVDYFISHDIRPEQLGISGSLLIGAETEGSDIDLVCYDQSAFDRIRHCFASSDGPFQPLSSEQWKQTYRRRGTTMAFDTFLRHEQRKHNKAIIGSHKIDISLVMPEPPHVTEIWEKRGPVQCTARVIDDCKAFHTPARWGVDHPTISEVISYSATFTGHARAGEWVALEGLLEENENGMRRVILGQSREAKDAIMHVHPSTERPL